jgi:hypothetical protein
MAVGSCPECNGKLSTVAEKCPHCGYTVRRSDSRTQVTVEVKQESPGCLRGIGHGVGVGVGCVLFLVVLALVMLFSCGRLLSSEKARREAEQVAAARDAERPKHKPYLGVEWSVREFSGARYDPPPPPRIEVVNENTPPYRAGLRRGDRLISPALQQRRDYDGGGFGVGRTKYWIKEQWPNALPGDTVEVTIERGDGYYLDGEIWRSGTYPGGARQELRLKVPILCAKCMSGDACPFKRTQQ